MTWRRPMVLVGRWAAGMVVVLSVLFCLTAALPGDAADALAGADRAAAAELRQQLQLDQPLPIRLGQWWSGVLRGDLGVSLVDGRAVLPAVLDRFGATVWIAAPALVLGLAGAVTGAWAQAWLRGHMVGPVLAGTIAVLAGVPEIVLVVGLVLWLAVWWQLVPPVSMPPLSAPVWTTPEILVLPVLALAIPAAAWGARMLRGSADDLVAGQLVSAARRRGVPAGQIFTRHLVPRWSGPVIQVAAFLTAGVLGGSAVVESVLAYPGIGGALAAAVASRDLPMVQGIGVIVVGVTLTLLTLADLVTGRTTTGLEGAHR